MGLTVIMIGLVMYRFLDGRKEGDDMEATAKAGPIDWNERDAHKDEHRAKILHKHQS